MPSRSERNAAILHDRFAFGQPRRARFITICQCNASRSEGFHSSFCAICPVRRTRGARPVWLTARPRAVSLEWQVLGCPVRNRQRAVPSDGTAFKVSARPAGASRVFVAGQVLTTYDLVHGRGVASLRVDS